MFQVVKAASPVLLRIIILGAFFIYSTVQIIYIYLNYVNYEIICTFYIVYYDVGYYSFDKWKTINCANKATLK